MHTSLVAIALLLLAAPALAGPDEDVFVAIKAKSVITVSGEELSPGTVVIKNGRIEAVGERVEIPSKALVIEAMDEVVLPGLVNARSRFGMKSYQRSGNNSHLTVTGELFPRPGDYRDLLEHGFVAVGLIPSGGGIPGKAVVIRPLDGPRDELIQPEAGFLRVSFWSLPGDKRTLRKAFKDAEKAIERIEKARKAWEAKQKKAKPAKGANGKTPPKTPPKPPPPTPPKPTPPKPTPPKPTPPKPTPPKPTPPKPTPPKKGKPAKAAAKAAAKAKPAEFKPPPIPPHLKLFVSILREEEAPRMVLELSRSRDLVHFEDGFKDRKLTPTLFLSNNGRESDLFHVIERLGEAKANVLLYPKITNEPYTRTRRNLPAELVRAGVTVSFVPIRDDVSGLRGYLAAVAQLVREGLPRKEALAAMTLHPARIIGLADDLGAIEKGKRADLIFLNGDPLDVGVEVTRVMLDGELAWPKKGELR